MGPKDFWSKKIVDPNKFWVQKIWNQENFGPKTFDTISFVSSSLGPIENFHIKYLNSKKILSPKNFGSKNIFRKKTFLSVRFQLFYTLIEMYVQLAKMG